MSATSKLFRRLLTTTGTLALTLSMSANLHAEEGSADSPLEQVFQAQVNSYYSVNGFYNFSANQGAQKDLTAINDSIEKLDTLISSIENEIDQDNEATAYEEVSGAWKSYHKVLKQNIKEVEKTGYPDLRLAGDMAVGNIRLNASLSSLYEVLLATSSVKPDSTRELSRKAATKLALMMTKYSARTTSTVSQVYADGDSETEITIDTLAKEFGTQLEELSTLVKGNKNALKLLDSAITKWDFIESSYINYNENRVNFIVNLYSKKIISDIDLAISAI